MGEAGIALLSDEDEHARIAAAARRTAEERFSKEAVVPMYEEFYQRVLER